MAFSAPSYGSVDFGFGNTDSDSYRATCTGGLDATSSSRRQNILFNGVNGKWLLHMGLDPGQVAWRVTVWFKTVADRAAWEAMVRDAIDGESQELVFRGKTWIEAKIVDLQEIQILPALKTWAVGTEYLITFEALSLAA